MYGATPSSSTRSTQVTSYLVRVGVRVRVRVGVRVRVEANPTP